MVRSILCIRHGVTEMNEYLSCCEYGSRGFVDPGLYDTRLTARGEASAAGELRRNVQSAFARERIDLLVSSPLSRALRTAELGFEGLSVPRAVSPLLAERRYLSSDVGRSPRELARDFPTFETALTGNQLANEWWWEADESAQREALAARLRLQGGVGGAIKGVALAVEPDDDFTFRVAHFRRWLRDRPESRVAIVAHWGVFYSLLGGRSLRNCELVECAEADLLDEPVPPPG
mmetsp:Transcript_22770/g.49144  ORF Transcript_22770/g.49144 Transcript_22770/m.49144 type:complete len:233 (-) Transcript_22770:455-1153(-)